MNKPDVDYIKGLCPAIAIEQKVITRTPRSTVGSMTEVYDYLRLLYARIGKTISPISGREVKKDDVSDVVNAITELNEGDKVYILTTFKQHKNRDIKEELNILVQKGFSRVYVRETSNVKRETGEIIRIEDLLQLQDKELKQKLAARVSSAASYILIDRIVVKTFDEDDKHRLADSIGTAFYEGEGDVYLEVNGDKLFHFNNRFELDGMQFEEPVPNLFNFNNPFGACPTCEGFSQVLGIDTDLVIPDKRLSVYEGAVEPWKGEKLGRWREQFVKGARKIDFPVHKSIGDLTDAQYKLLWEGAGKVCGINDFFKEVEQNLYKVQYRVLLSRYRGRTQCPDCHGYRLRNEALYVKIDGKHIGELSELAVKYLKEWFDELEKKLSDFDNQVARRILLEISSRINTLLNVGLGYLTLSRLANSLSGGESQRIQLTRSLGSNLTNSLYILDEPTTGLHPSDVAKLIIQLNKLVDAGNTVIVVEHDMDVVTQSDWVIDIGPGAGDDHERRNCPDLPAHPVHQSS